MNTQLLEQEYIRVRKLIPGARPRFGLILGSGLTGITDNFSVKADIPASPDWNTGELPVPGHAGKLLLAERAGLETLIFCGRHHWYEGLGWEPIALPVYLLKKLGVSTVILTNAAGGIREDLSAGSIMIIDDHINSMGVNPLTGNSDSIWGTRFADQSGLYDGQLRAQLEKAAEHAGTLVRHGTYLATSGPTYETPAEIRAFRAMGADAVGMSTVPEAILANAAGLRVAGLSCIANRASGLKNGSLSHEEVLEAVQRSVPALKAILAALWDEMALRTDNGPR